MTSGGDLAEDERGGTAVVLLHGFGASGDDLVSLARSLARPRTRFVVPAGLLTLSNGGRAWWQLEQRPAYDAAQELLVDQESLLVARRAVQGVLSTIRERYAPECAVRRRLLARRHAWRWTSRRSRRLRVDRVALLSGALPQPTSRALAKPRQSVRSCSSRTAAKIASYVSPAPSTLVERLETLRATP